HGRIERREERTPRSLKRSPEREKIAVAIPAKQHARGRRRAGERANLTPAGIALKQRETIGHIAQPSALAWRHIFPPWLLPQSVHRPGEIAHRAQHKPILGRVVRLAG